MNQPEKITFQSAATVIEVPPSEDRWLDIPLRVNASNIRCFFFLNVNLCQVPWIITVLKLTRMLARAIFVKEPIIWLSVTGGYRFFVIINLPLYYIEYIEI